MKKTYISTLFLALMLSACGGDDDGGSSSSSAASESPSSSSASSQSSSSQSSASSQSASASSQSSSASSVSSSSSSSSSSIAATGSIPACFDAPIGLKMQMSDPEAPTVEVINSMLGGQPYKGFARINENGYRETIDHYRITDGGVEMVGVTQYINPSIDSTEYWEWLWTPVPVIPAGMGIGELKTFAYRETASAFDANGPKTTGFVPPPSDDELKITFMGYETLTAGGRTFKDVCHFRIFTPTSVRHTFFAPGYGLVKSYGNNPTDTTLQDAGVSLVKVLVQP